MNQARTHMIYLPHRILLNLKILSCPAPLPLASLFIAFAFASLCLCLSRVGREGRKEEKRKLLYGRDEWDGNQGIQGRGEAI